MLFRYRRKYLDLKKKYDELLSWYKRLYSLYNSCISGNLEESQVTELIRRRIAQNSQNIRNHNSKDDKYATRRYVCLDGQKVRSKVEREIYNYLILNGVKVRYEAMYKTPWGSVIRPDFYLPDYKLYIEYFGKDPGEDEKYDEITKFKNQLYNSVSTPFVILTHHDDEALYSVLKFKLSKYVDVSSWI